MLSLLPFVLLMAGQVSWNPALLRNASHWTERMNGAIVSASEQGLKVTIGADKTWAIAAVPEARLPGPVVVGLRVRVGAISRNARWLVRLYGHLRNSRTPVTVGLFEGAKTTGTVSTVLDRRLVQPGGLPLQVQLGLEGKEGDYVIFEDVQFVSEQRRPAAYVPHGQVRIAAVDMMPDLPQPLNILDWHATAKTYDQFVFDLNAKGEHLPLVWLDESRVNQDRTGFGMCSYVGDGRQGGSTHESITSLGAVLSGSLVGIDKSKQQYDWVNMCAQYYNVRNSQRLVLNSVNHPSGQSYWYDIFPHIVFYAISDRYPRNAVLDDILRATAARWLECVQRLRDSSGLPNFNHTGFDFSSMQPHYNGSWREPDAAAGVAWLQFSAWKRTGDRRHLAAARDCLKWITSLENNPYYEVLLPWGAIAAARMNAEEGASLDLHRILQWCFGLSDFRGGWSVITSRWGAFDCHGLVGSVDNRGGYAFAMNTFVQAGALTPIPRYDARYAHAIGKWMLNLVNAARLFYPRSLPKNHQCCADWNGDPHGVIAYEGLRQMVNGKSPFATGDPVELNWGPKTDLGLYGSSYVGMLGAVVRKTNVPGILALDCLATDFFREPAFPTFLLYNPYKTAKIVAVPGAGAKTDLYDAVTNRIVARGRSHVRLAQRSAAVIVLLPRGTRLVTKGGRVRAGDVVVRW